MYNEYDIGDLIRLDVDITMSGTYLDPSHLSLQVLDPRGITHTFIYGQTGTFIKEDTGKYYLDFYVAYSGQYKYRFYSSGTAWGAENQRFVVKRE